MFFINFIKSLFVPNRMAKYATMHILIAIAIFFVASYVLAYPASYHASKNRYQLVDDQNAYSLQIFQAFDAEDIDILNNTGFKVEKGQATINESVHQGEAYIFNINADNKISHVYVVFDLYNILDPEAKPHYDINEKFTNMEKVEGEDYYLLVFYLDRLYYRNPSISNELQYGSKINIDFTTMEDGSELSYRMMDLYIPIIKSENTFKTFISTVIYTFVIILMLYIFFRLSGSTYTLKELYNIGSIAAIAPLVVTIILAFIFPKIDFISYYSSGFGIYYLIMMLLINNKTKIA